MINNVTVVGNITEDPKLKKTESGIAVMNFTLAVNKRTRADEAPKEPNWIRCVAWRHNAVYLDKYVKKGMTVGVMGSIQTRTYKDKDGKTQYIQEVLAENVYKYSPSISSEQTETEDTFIPDDYPEEGLGLEDIVDIDALKEF